MSHKQILGFPQLTEVQTRNCHMWTNPVFYCASDFPQHSRASELTGVRFCFCPSRKAGDFPSNILYTNSASLGNAVQLRILPVSRFVRHLIAPFCISSNALKCILPVSTLFSAGNVFCSSAEVSVSPLSFAPLTLTC